jgi:hypothetical protein
VGWSATLDLSGLSNGKTMCCDYRPGATVMTTGLDHDCLFLWRLALGWTHVSTRLESPLRILAGTGISLTDHFLL